MSWSYEDEQDGLPYAMFSEVFRGRLDGPLAAFSLRDEETVRAIHILCRPCNSRKGDK